MNESLKNDPRLKNLNPDRIEKLLAFSRALEDAPGDQKMQTFLTMSQQASKDGLKFTPQETDLLLSVLMESMSPNEKKRAQMIMNLARKMRSET